MLRLYGFLGSNYYSVVKLALLEKGMPFEEVHVPLGALGKLDPDPDYRHKSPIQKVPALETESGFLSETSAILDYLDDRQEGPSFYPAEAYTRAKVRELIKYMELYIELPARQLYGEILHGRAATEERRDEVQGLLRQGFEALEELAHFDPYIAGEQLSYADFFAQFCLTTATWVTRECYGWDTFNTLPGLRAAMELVRSRQATQRVLAERHVH